VSRCLLGDPVRYDGETKRNAVVSDILSTRFELVPVCPEVEFGMSIPREAIELQGNPETPRLIGLESGTDFTDGMQTWCRERVKKLEMENLHGFIFKCRSPSCGLIFQEQYRGLFARTFMDAFPGLPVTDEEGLANPEWREKFIARVSNHRENC